MIIKIDSEKTVFFVTLIMVVRKEEKIDENKREVYQTICKNSKTELDAINEATLEAQRKFHIVNVEAKMASKLKPSIFLK